MAADLPGKFPFFRYFVVLSMRTIPRTTDLPLVCCHLLSKKSLIECTSMVYQWHRLPVQKPNKVEMRTSPSNSCSNSIFTEDLEAPPVNHSHWNVLGYYFYSVCMCVCLFRPCISICDRAQNFSSASMRQMHIFIGALQRAPQQKQLKSCN